MDVERQPRTGRWRPVRVLLSVPVSSSAGGSRRSCRCSSSRDRRGVRSSPIAQTRPRRRAPLRLVGDRAVAYNKRPRASPAPAPAMWRSRSSSLNDRRRPERLLFTRPRRDARLHGRLGAVCRARRAGAPSSASAPTRAERERESERAAAVAEERARIARELHDVVAHSVSVMRVQAGAARGSLLDRARSASARRSARSRRPGREALAEMRRLLGVLREDDEERARAAAGPRRGSTGWSSSVRDGGPARSSCAVEGDPRPLPAGRRPVRLPDRPGGAHERAQARRRRARRVSSSATQPSALEIEVADDGPARARTAAAATASSACASASRSTAATSRPGPRPGGGFAVRVAAAGRAP